MIEACVRSMLDQHYPRPAGDRGRRRLHRRHRRASSTGWPPTTPVEVAPPAAQRRQEARPRRGRPPGPRRGARVHRLRLRAGPRRRSSAASPPSAPTRASAPSPATPGPSTPARRCSPPSRTSGTTASSAWPRRPRPSFGSVTCVSGPLAAFRREAIVNYFPAWADGPLPRPGVPLRHRPPAHRLRARPAVGRRAAAGRARRRPARRRRAAPAPAVAGGLRAIGPGVDQGPADVRCRSCASRCGGRRASSATCSSPVASSGAEGWSRRSSTTATPCGWLLGPLMAFRHLVLLPLQGAWLVSAPLRRRRGAEGPRLGARLPGAEPRRPAVGAPAADEPALGGVPRVAAALLRSPPCGAARGHGCRCRRRRPDRRWRRTSTPSRARP